jgi:two-component system, LytTR family, response regulator
VKIRTLIVDDEALARRSLASLLQAEADFEVVGECADGEAALRAVAERAPEVLFLDVQMPGMDGFNLLGALGRERAPAVVFVTAFEQFAVRAFEAQALDYLMKPFRRERFQACLERVRQHHRARSQASASAATRPDRMVVKCGDRLVFIPLESLDYVRAAANYVRLHVAEASYQVRERMAALEARLPPERFMRIHRSYIVNLDALKELHRAGDGEYLVAVRGGRHLPVGPSYTEALRAALASTRVPRFGGSLGI